MSNRSIEKPLALSCRLQSESWERIRTIPWTYHERGQSAFADGERSSSAFSRSAGIHSAARGRSGSATFALDQGERRSVRGLPGRVGLCGTLILWHRQNAGMRCACQVWFFNWVSGREPGVISLREGAEAEMDEIHRWESPWGHARGQVFLGIPRLAGFSGIDIQTDIEGPRTSLGLTRPQ